MAADGRVPSTPLCRVFGDGRAQVDTASLADMHGEAEKTEKQKARGYCVGAGLDMCMGAGVDMLRQCK